MSLPLHEKRCGLMKLFALMSRGEIFQRRRGYQLPVKPIGGLSLFSSVQGLLAGVLRGGAHVATEIRHHGKTPSRPDRRAKATAIRVGPERPHRRFPFSMIENPSA